MKKIFCSFFALCLLAPIFTFAGPEYDNLTMGLQKDVIAFVDRVIACNYWPGEMPSDADSAEVRASGRPQMIKKELKKAKCSSLKKDEKKIRAKYKKQKRILEAIERSKSLGPND